MWQDLRSLFGLGRVNDRHPRAQCVRPRPQAPLRQTFDSDAIQRLYESDDYPMQRLAPD